MIPKIETCIQAIGKIRQEIDSVNLSDQEAWKTIGKEMEALVQDFPQNLAVPLKTVGLCTQAVQFLAETTKAHSFALIEALLQALNATENYLLDQSDKKPAIQKAERQLTEALVKEQGGPAANPTKETYLPEDLSSATLDDAAALLIQLVPDDMSVERPK